MPFKIDTARKVLALYTNELDYQNSVRISLESKASTNIQITGIMLGLIGTMFTLFFVFLSQITPESYINQVNAFILSSIFTVSILFISLITTFFTIFIRKWERPVYYQKFSVEKEQPKSNSINVALDLCNADEDLLLKDILRLTVLYLTKYLSKNSKISKILRAGFVFIIIGLINFIVTIIILILFGVMIFL